MHGPTIPRGGAGGGAARPAEAQPGRRGRCQRGAAAGRAGNTRGPPRPFVVPHTAESCGRPEPPTPRAPPPQSVRRAGEAPLPHSGALPAGPTPHGSCPPAPRGARGRAGPRFPLTHRCGAAPWRWRGARGALRAAPAPWRRRRGRAGAWPGHGGSQGPRRPRCPMTAPGAADSQSRRCGRRARAEPGRAAPPSCGARREA